ncbi:MAG: iron-sulfur cluster carrier protein ApbC [Endozoicomonas sp. (ex Botrylloides leachii)]|nr:iron-sulfur cluster carrier protein ApbC [Endozoicomonas sp. (ex Botrylloides leachii)]
MRHPNRVDVETALRSYQDPYLKQDLLSADCIKSIDLQDGKVRITVELSYPAKGLCSGIAQLLTSKVEDISGIKTVDVSVDWQVNSAPVQSQLDVMEGVKNIIAVASAKGGVGKSTTAANLALALAKEGARVGVLDADIYGPSMGLMFGIQENQRPDIQDNCFFVPIEAHGIQLMSMAFLVTEDTPIVWRGPMVSGALQQLLTQTAWDQLDYLIIDMPPGTGDIQLTLAQKVPVTGSVIVTTPQDLALIDAKKSIEMFHKVDIPVLGVIENMAVHLCSQCGHMEQLFGENGGSRIAETYATNLLGSLPLSIMIREQADAGKPTVAAEEDSQITMIYCDIARQMTAQLSLKNKDKTVFPEISMTTD